MIERLLGLATVGGEAILYLLIGLSLLSLTVALERLWVYARNRVDLPRLCGDLTRLLNAGDLAAAQERVQAGRSAEESVTRDGLLNFSRPGEVAGQLMEAARLREQQRLDRRLNVLGTVGANAPFVGLLGTVLGIIRAFADLSRDVQGGPSVVMSGIAEALVATAVGLLVAIPAVVAYNYFKGRQKQILTNVGQLQRLVLALHQDRRAEPAAPAGSPAATVGAREAA